MLSQFCFSQKTVILRVKADEQVDTLGVNIVNEITKVAYEAIRDGKVKLWDSPKKEVAISFNSLVQIEKSSGLNFIDQQLIYIYDVWNYEKKKLKSETHGFLFSSKLENGDAVVFGYVEYDAIKSIIATSSASINANGDCYINLNNNLKKKDYNYQILQFGDMVINNVSDSKLLKESYIRDNKFNVEVIAKDSVESKFIEWTISSSEKLSGTKAQASRDFINALTTYFQQNMEVLYNLSGKNAEEILQNGTWKVSSISFAEIWKKSVTGIKSTPLWMSVSIDSVVIDSIYMDNLVNWEFTVNDQNWLEYIQQKNFLYLIVKVNSDVIPIEKSIKYQKGLFTHKWNNLINFVELY
ncbi:MAG: hypothetical protein RL516_2080 [Bacteroidota bacterium]